MAAARVGPSNVYGVPCCSAVQHTKDAARLLPRHAGNIVVQTLVLGRDSSQEVSCLMPTGTYLSSILHHQYWSDICRVISLAGHALIRKHEFWRLMMMMQMMVLLKGLVRLIA